MINVLEIRRHDSAVTNAVVITSVCFALTKCFDYLGLPLYYTLGVD